MANNIPEDLKPQLTNLAFTLGGMDNVAKLPTETIIKAIAHPDDTIGISKNHWVFELTNIIGNYEVFDKALKFMYEGTTVDSKWGTSIADIAMLVQVPEGTYFYVAYNTDEEERLILVIKQ